MHLRGQHSLCLTNVCFNVNGAGEQIHVSLRPFARACAAISPPTDYHVNTPSATTLGKNQIHPQMIFCKNRQLACQTLTDTQDNLIHDNIAVYCVVETRPVRRCGPGNAKYLDAQMDKQEHESLIMSINNEY